METITRCPACEIAFHVTEDQLQLAEGKVRCGACLTVFNAREYIEYCADETPAETIDADNDDLLIYDEMDPSAVPDHQPADSQLAPVEETAETADPTLLLPPPKVPLTATVTELPSGEVIELGYDHAADDPTPFDESPDREQCPFTAPQRKRRRFRPLLITACLLTLLALPAQYIYFHFDQLARNPQYHQWLTSACKVLGCEVPALADISKITPTRLVIVSHPSEQGALLAEAILENRAGFAQPFPDLLLKFDDLQGVTIAQRRFRPEEYLSGELAGARLFPSHRPVRIRLEVVDPGDTATSYALLVTE